MKVFLCALMLAILTMSANRGAAALIDQGTWTVDTDQNLAFLHLTQTVNYSWGDMQSALQAGGAFAGWRYATVPEITTLFEDAGIPDIGEPGVGSKSEANYVPVGNLIDLLGGPTGTVENTDTGWTREYIRGFINQTYNLGHATNYLGTDAYVSGGSTGTAVPGINGSAVDAYISDDMGHWLVRPAPEPTSLTLFGLAGLALLRRKRRDAH